MGGFPNGIFVASAANFISEGCTQNLRPMMSSLLAFTGLIGVTLGIATGSQRIPFVTSGEYNRWRSPFIVGGTGTLLTANFLVDRLAFLEIGSRYSVSSDSASVKLSLDD